MYSAFNNDASFRKAWIQEMESASKNSRFEPGTYYFASTLCGCFVGIGDVIARRLVGEDYARGDIRWHQDLAHRLRIPPQIPAAWDYLFEEFYRDVDEDGDEYSEIRSIADAYILGQCKAIRCGADLSSVWPNLLFWLITTADPTAAEDWRPILDIRSEADPAYLALQQATEGDTLRLACSPKAASFCVISLCREIRVGIALDYLLQDMKHEVVAKKLRELIAAC